MSTSYVDKLRKAGYRITPTRCAVLDVIEQEGDHLNPAEILDHARAKHPKIGRATVYRTLELLTEIGLVRPIYVNEDGLTYIRAQGGHHHMVCSCCGLVIDFDECVAGSMIDELRERYGFEVQSHLLEFYGVCEKCKEGPGHR